MTYIKMTYIESHGLADAPIGAFDLDFRSFNEINHAIGPVDFERELRDRPPSVFFDGLQENPPCSLGAGRRKAEDCTSGCTIGRNRAHRKAGRYRGAQRIGRLGAGPKCGCAEFVGLGISEKIESAAKYPAEQRDRAEPDDGAPDRPQALRAFEMRDAVPSPIAPRP